VELHRSRIHIGAGLLDSCGAEIRAALPRHRLAIISDDTVAPLYAERLMQTLGAPAPLLLTIPAGEPSKTREQWSRLTDELLDAGFGRDSAIIALGGGVVGDLAGFVAATFMRGIPFVQIPTTLLAMIDASIGGKTGVDTRSGKNLVGAFHHPKLVIADPSAFATLPPAHFRNGLAEAVKHAVIASPPDFEWLGVHASMLAGDAGPAVATAEELVRRNIEIKADVVARDEREGGLRKILNFGHTIGHAIETLSGYAILHGECVAIGMVVEARVAVHAGVGDTATVRAITELLQAVGLPITVPASMSTAKILDATRTDKKSRGGQVEYALPTRIGTMAGAEIGYGTPIADAIVTTSIDETRE
jgi:3-dehydroquinate synthase